MTIYNLTPYSIQAMLLPGCGCERVDYGKRRVAPFSRLAQSIQMNTPKDRSGLTTRRFRLVYRRMEMWKAIDGGISVDVI